MCGTPYLRVRPQRVLNKDPVYASPTPSGSHPSPTPSGCPQTPTSCPVRCGFGRHRTSVSRRHDRPRHYDHHGRRAAPNQPRYPFGQERGVQSHGFRPPVKLYFRADYFSSGRLEPAVAGGAAPRPRNDSAERHECLRNLLPGGLQVASATSTVSPPRGVGGTCDTSTTSARQPRANVQDIPIPDDVLPSLQTDSPFVAGGRVGAVSNPVVVG